MSNDHTKAIAGIQLAAPTKAVLWAISWHACAMCGICWAGVPLLCRETCLSESSVRRSLVELRERKLIRVVGYDTGGRGRATEYVVAPDLVPLPTGVCGKCGKTTA